MCSICGQRRSHDYLCLNRDSNEWISGWMHSANEHTHTHTNEAYVAIIFIVLCNYDFRGRLERFSVFDLAAANVSSFRTNSSTFDGWSLMAFQWCSIDYTFLYQVHRVRTEPLDSLANMSVEDADSLCNSRIFIYLCVCWMHGQNELGVGGI